MTLRTAPFLALVTLVSGYVLWSLAFVALYAGHALSCAGSGARPALGQPIAVWVLLGLWALFIVAHLGLVQWVRRQPRPDPTQAGASRFLRAAMVALAATAGVATVWIGVPLLLVDPC